MTARADAEKRVRSCINALGAALKAKPVDRPRVAELATRLADAVDALPTDERFAQLDRAVGAAATEALVWSCFPELADPEDLPNAVTTIILIRRVLHLRGITPPI